MRNNPTRTKTLRCWLAGALLIGGSIMFAPAAAAPESLERAFGTDGVRVLAGPWTEASKIVTLADGRMLVTVNSPFWDFGTAGPLAGLWRLVADGSADETFGQRGFLASRQLCGIDCPIADFALTHDALYVIAGYRVHRLGLDGESVPGYGEGGVGAMPPGLPLFAARKIVVADDDSVLVAGLHDRDYRYGPASVYRLRSLGSFDASFGANGTASLGEDDSSVYALLLQPDGRIVALKRTGLWRFTADGKPDESFGQHGVVNLSLRVGPTAVLANDGRIVVAGTEYYVPEDLVIAVIAIRPDGSVDPDFGSGGVARVRTDRSEEDTYATNLTMDGAGRFLIVGDAGRITFIPFDFEFTRIVVSRLLPNGAPDVHFAPGGVAAFWSGYRSMARAVAVQPDGRIVVAGVSDAKPGGGSKYPRYNAQAALYALQGGSTVLPRPFLESQAIEFFNAGFNHYFMTTDPLEAARLDVQEPREWSRTGHTFNAWSAAGADRAPVCRFWSDQAFVPKSSHFYTPYDAECTRLKAQGGNPWVFEGSVFALKLPAASAGGLVCPSDARPLYRAYNNGMSGAPNHRYTTDSATLDSIVAQGWIMEGDAATRIFACAPIQP